jgi:tRNA nucleotidyltransferase (CCA-adding enzyme)
VGGAVRDALLGLPHKDLDIEVFGLPLPHLKEVLARAGRVDAVGEAFTVFKVSGLEGAEGAVDVSLPRRDSKAGPRSPRHRRDRRSGPEPRGRPPGAGTSRSTP